MSGAALTVLTTRKETIRRHALQVKNGEQCVIHSAYRNTANMLVDLGEIERLNVRTPSRFRPILISRSVFLLHLLDNLIHFVELPRPPYIVEKLAEIEPIVVW